jgi:hypothetical protein
MTSVTSYCIEGRSVRAARLWNRIHGHSWPAFQVCGCAGLGLAFLLATTLACHQGFSYFLLVKILAAAVAAFLLLVTTTQILTGEERIIYYHHEIGVMIAAAFLLRVLHQPLLPYLDITILGIGTFLTFGRIGCLLVGCCHGRPCSWGVRYSEDHAAAGFPSYLVGVRLFPIQAVESLWVLCTVVVGTFFVWTGSVRGTALAWYVIIYGFARFFFEFARGDADRSYWLGFSQPQWLSLLLTGGVLWAEMAGILPFFRWHVAVLSLLITTMVVVSLKRKFQSTTRFELLHAKHIRQVAIALKTIADGSNFASDLVSADNTTAIRVPVLCTPLGIQISGSELHSDNRRVHQFTISSVKQPITEKTARVVAGLIRRLSGLAGRSELLAERSVFHLLIWGAEASA